MLDFNQFPTAGKLNKLIKRAGKLRPTIKVAVVHPTLAVVVKGAVVAAQHNLIEPVFIGPIDRIKKVANKAKVNLDAYTLINEPYSHAASARAVAMARSGEVATLMKGGQPTDEFLKAVLNRDTGLRTDRRLSHCFLMDVPDHKKLLLLTDAAINMTPDLDAKKDIVQNAVDLALSLGIQDPKVALLAAVEMINAKMPATLDAAALCKMADRQQIKGGILDGPLAYDNAISAKSAKIKNIHSPVAGHADILVVPNLESGNMLAKQLIYLANAHAAGIVLGAKVPIILTSRSDDIYARVASCALAKMLIHALDAVNIKT